MEGKRTTLTEMMLGESRVMCRFIQISDLFPNFHFLHFSNFLPVWYSDASHQMALFFVETALEGVVSLHTGGLKIDRIYKKKFMFVFLLKPVIWYVDLLNIKLCVLLIMILITWFSFFLVVRISMLINKTMSVWLLLRWSAKSLSQT